MVDRKCLDCPTDISDRHPNTKRCAECARKRKGAKRKSATDSGVKDAVPGDEYTLSLLHKQEAFRLAKIKREEGERRAAQECGALVPRDVVDTAHRRAASEFRRGAETLRRDLAATCDPGTLARLDAGLEALRLRLGAALEPAYDRA